MSTKLDPFTFIIVTFADSSTFLYANKRCVMARLFYTLPAASRNWRLYESPDPAFAFFEYTFIRFENAIHCNWNKQMHYALLRFISWLSYALLTYTDSTSLRTKYSILTQYIKYLKRHATGLVTIDKRSIRKLVFDRGVSRTRPIGSARPRQ